MAMYLPRLSSSPSSSSSSPSNSERRLTRAKQLRHLRDCDVKQLEFFLNSPAGGRQRDVEGGDLWRSSSAPPPQPLPLPDLSALFSSAERIVNRREKLKLKAKGKGGEKADGFRLPSPTGAPNATSNAIKAVTQDARQSVDAQRRVDARRRVDVQGQGGANPHRSVHRAETWSSTNVAQHIMGADHQGSEKLCVDVSFGSAPQSTNASPMVSPQRMPNGDMFSSYHVEPKRWSDPAMPSSFPRVSVSDSAMVSLSRDSSPIDSVPGKSPVRSRKSTSGPASPRHHRLHFDISSSHNDSNVFMNGHPLPLPPTPASAIQASPLPQGSTRTDYMPVSSQWTKGKLIGRGTFGSVYVATNRETGALCAMKEVELCPDDPKSAECMRQLEQEIKVLSHLKHPNIVQYYGSEIVDDRFYIFLEYVYPGSINKYVREHCGAITEAVVRNFTRHICSGLAYLHGRKTIHRDIKGANLLVDASGVVKLADFGMAKHLTGQAAELSLKGSPYWMAPELMQSVMRKDNSSDLAFAIDIWSLGCTIIEMLTGKPPWSEVEGPAAMFKVLRESPSIPETLSPEGKDFLNCCFRRNPADRLPASKLLEHPFLRNCQHMDVPTASHALEHQDKALSPSELYNHKLDKMQLSPGRWEANGKSSTNETGLLPRLETSDMTVGRRHSPRSILEPFTTLSPPYLVRPPKLLFTANASSGMSYS